MDATTAAELYSGLTLPALPFLPTVLMLLVALPLAAVLGFVTGAARRRTLDAGGESPEALVGETTLGAILALLGLILAFTFANALSVSQDRKAALNDEAAALGTAFLRADYLPEPGRADLQSALLDYARSRVVPEEGRLGSAEALRAFIGESLQLQARLWPLTLEATADPVPPPIKSFAAGAVNEVLDAHLARMQTLSAPVANITQGMMLSIAVVALFLLGNRAGIAGRPLTWRTFVFAYSLFAVMVTITDVQRATEGFVRLNDSNLRATIFDMEQALAARD